jgi:hypothetical protein
MKTAFVIQIIQLGQYRAKSAILFFFLVFASLVPLSAISWRPVLVVEEAGILGENN